jgi:hypothetical protein
MLDPSVILLEFNELSPALMTRFIDDGQLPNFQRLAEQSFTYVTDAEERAPNLEPWIQWVTVHTGLSYTEHGVFDLDDGHKLQAPRLWDLASAAGKRVWVCGSMNIGYRPPIRGMVLPDPWSSGVSPFPSELQAYYDFVQRHVQEYTRDDVPLTKSDYVRFLAFMATHGLSMMTIRAIARQLFAERSGRLRWRRATILDRLQWDVFRWYYVKTRPHLSTFFLNSTAHFQHTYWRNMDPEPFSVKPVAEEQREYDSAVLSGYQAMDHLVGECLRLADAATTIVFASALGQQPCLLYEAIGGKAFYKPREPERFLAFAGITQPHRYSPVMSEQFHVYFDSETDAREAVARLTALRVNGRPFMDARVAGVEVFAGCNVFETVDHSATVDIPGTAPSARFLDLFYKVDVKKSGMHHPDGLLWIRTPPGTHMARSDKVPLRSVAPTILSLLNIPRPAAMTADPLWEVVGQPLGRVA